MVVFALKVTKPGVGWLLYTAELKEIKGKSEKDTRDSDKESNLLNTCRQTLS